MENNDKRILNIEREIDIIKEDIREIRESRFKDGKNNNIVCNYCGYNWFTRSKLSTVSCPSCGMKVKKENNIKTINSN